MITSQSESEIVVERENNLVYAQFGCGLCAPMEWINFDVSPSLRFQRIPFLGRFFVGQFGAFPKNVKYGDIVKQLPMPPSSCSGMYSSHVLEHLSLVDFRTALKNVFFHLKPGGTFRFVLPDLEYLANTYLLNSGAEACSWFMRESHLGREVRERGLKALCKEVLGNSRHLWMWDFAGLESELAQVGFSGIRRAFFNDSSDPIFKLVEEERRWIDQLGVECAKPL